ncbi:MAG: DNA ligase [Polyangiaceae bacterium]
MAHIYLQLRRATPLSNEERGILGDHVVEWAEKLALDEAYSLKVALEDATHDVLVEGCVKAEVGARDDLRSALAELSKLVDGAALTVGDDEGLLDDERFLVTEVELIEDGLEDATRFATRRRPAVESSAKATPLRDLADGESTKIPGSGSSVYTLKNTGGVYSCSCPAWMHQSIGIERRTCKHLRAFRGDAAEQDRLGTAELSGKPTRAPSTAKSASSTSASTSSSSEPALLLAHKWEGDVDLTGWWLSEKLDGVRAYWDGSQFLSRLGNKFHAPAWFTAGLPNTPLDGELWSGRKLFQRTVGIVKRQDQSPLWKELFYVVFDAPAHGGVFEERVAHCEDLFAKAGHAYVRVHAHMECLGNGHLREELARVEALGGEGLMARRPKSKYEAGRSSTLLKVKNFHDAEARVIGHEPGAGRHKGRLGALVVELADGTRFNVGTGFSDQERERPPGIGALITFRYQELSDGGVPRFPSYVGVRDDVRGPSVLVSKPAPKAAPRAVVANEAPPPAMAPATEALRRFEMSDGDTKYFWEIWREGAVHRVRYGTFDAKVKRFEDEASAAAALESRIRDKLANGFVEVENSGTAGPRED